MRRRNGDRWRHDARILGLCVFCVCARGLRCIADYPQWGGSHDRNMVADVTGLPDDFAVGDSRLNEADMQNVLWATRLGSHTYGNPAVSGGKVFVGTNDASLRDERLRKTGGGMIHCLDRGTGETLWTLVVPRFRTSLKDFNFDDMNLGICSAPTVERNRVYVVSNRGEVLCLDTEGMANGNDGPYQDEVRFMGGSHDAQFALSDRDGDILWCFDMVRELPCWPQDAASSAALVWGDFVYVGTSNGVDNSHRHVPYPDAPNLIVLDKRTGRLVGRDREKIGHHLFHGQWSSPTLAMVEGEPQVLYGAGDAYCYAFEPVDESPPAGEVRVLRRIWRCDCTPPAYKNKPYQREIYRSWRSDVFGEGPSEIIGTPVYHKGYVYVTVGQDTLHGRGAGAVTCIDASGQGEVTDTHRKWQNTDVDRTLCTVSVHEGLLYVGDYSGRVHCLDAKSGRRYWVHDTKSPLWSSTLVADGEIYFGTEHRDLWVLKAGREHDVLRKVRLPHPMQSTAVASDGVLFFATERAIYAVGSADERE